MAGTRTRRDRASPEDEQRSDRPQPDPHERVLALQRDVGNQATGALLQRREITEGPGAVVRFTIGSDISLLLAKLAWDATASGPLDEAAVGRLRDVALGTGESIDDTERMFIAALLDAGNARSWHAPGATLTPGAAIGFPTASITTANRALVRDFGRTTRPPGAAHADGAGEAENAAQLDQEIVAMAGPFAATARAALAIADAAKIKHLDVYFAMLNGASDSTPGDRALAAAVYAIARREGLPAAADIMAGRIKVDAVPRASLPRNAEGLYQPAASTSGRKGDTVYLPSDLNFLDVVPQGTVVHELTHAADDADAKKPNTPPVVDSELTAYRAEAGFLLHAVARRSGAEHDRALLQVAKEIRLPTLLCMVLEATEVMEYERALTSLREIHAKVLSDGDPRTALDLKAGDMASLLRRLADEEKHYDAFVEVEKRARKAISNAYTGIAPALDDGLLGESVLDTPAASAGAPVARAVDAALADAAHARRRARRPRRAG